MRLPESSERAQAAPADREVQPRSRPPKDRQLLQQTLRGETKAGLAVGSAAAHKNWTLIAVYRSPGRHQRRSLHLPARLECFLSAVRSRVFQASLSVQRLLNLLARRLCSLGRSLAALPSWPTGAASAGLAGGLSAVAFDGRSFVSRKARLAANPRRINEHTVRTDENNAFRLDLDRGFNN